MFTGCYAFNDSIDHWDVGNVTNMKWLFFADTSFNKPLAAWDVGNVTDMSGMFSVCYAFNQDISAGVSIASPICWRCFRMPAASIKILMRGTWAM